MTIIKAQPGDSTDSLIRKFAKKVAADGILQDFRRREFYQKPSQARKEKAKERARRKVSRRSYGTY